MSKLRFTPKGEKIVNDYISNAKKKKEEILKNRFRYYHDENDDTKIPTSNDILLDIRWEEEGTIFWDDPEGPCYRAVWPVTKTYDAGILRLKLDEDFEIPDDNTSDDTSDQEHMNMRYMLVSVTRRELDIIESFHPTQEKAYEAMMEDILISTSYESEEEIRSDAEEGKCGLSDNDAWAETMQFGTCSWKIIELPVPQKMFVYKQYNDEYAYGEEDIQVFPDKDDAIAELRKDVEAHYGVPWKYVPFKVSKILGEEAIDSFEPDYVVIGLPGEAALHWIIEEKETKITKRQ